MRKENSTQLEFFAHSKLNSADYPAGNKAGALSGFIRSYQRAVLIALLFIITGITSFCLGVEKGKRITVLKSGLRINMAVVQENPVKEEKQDIVPVKPKDDDPDNYTIQLASYKTRKYAQKEADTLKKKGLLPLVLSKSGYAVLCVGNFSDKEAAKASLFEFKKRYRSCYVRRL